MEVFRLNDSMAALHCELSKKGNGHSLQIHLSVYVIRAGI